MSGRVAPTTLIGYSPSQSRTGQNRRLLTGSQPPSSQPPVSELAHQLNERLFTLFAFAAVASHTFRL